MELREMRHEDRVAVLDLLEHAFAVRELFERFMDFDPAFSYADVLLALDGGVPVSCVQTFERPIRLRYERVLLGGIGSVATHTSARGKGLASELLRRAIARMRERGMALSLLFTGRFSFYEPLGFQQMSTRLFKLAPGAPLAPPDDGTILRAFEPADLERVRALYDVYTEPLSGPTVRDARYWAGQLRTAGTPHEDFRVAERGGALLAYARAASFSGRTRVLEYARSAGGAGALARLLAAHRPAEHRLPVPLVRDAELGDALRGFGLDSAPGEDPSPMWLVLDRPALARIAGASESTSDRALLESLVGGPLVTYWPSDRF
ncbi:MAG: GNAT family N-acetyltransferase [Myxococcota bacterium]